MMIRRFWWILVGISLRFPPVWKDLEELERFGGIYLYPPMSIIFNRRDNCKTALVGDM